MNSYKYQLNKKDYLYLFIIISVSLFLYLFNISFNDIWVDETFTKELVKKPINELLNLLSDDFHPPLYFLGLKFFTSIFGTSGFSLRLFSVLGAVLTIVISYIVGQKVFGKKGAFYFSILLLSIPMMAYNAQTARMYTWAVFFSTGVFLYACIFVKTGHFKDLLLLGIFSILALYTHYYCIIAAFWANIFVLAYLFFKKKPFWKAHLVMCFILIILYIPWLFVFFKHIGAANEGFWIAPPSLQTIIECYTYPFALQFTLVKSSYILLGIVYIISLISIYYTFKKSKKGNILRIALLMSLVIYNATILTAIIISLFSQSIVNYRYVMTMVSMLMVPVTIYFIMYKNTWIRNGLILLIFSLSAYLSISATYFSHGPYKQAIEHLQDTHPEIHKIIYQSEVSLGPMLNYATNNSLKHYWLENDKSIYFTNLKVYDKLQMVNSIDEILEENEVFCFAGIWKVPLNLEIADMIISENTLLSVDTIIDYKEPNGVQILLHYLQYKNPESSNNNNNEVDE